MEVKCLEVRDKGTFIPIICIRPVPMNAEQRYLLRRDGYSGNDSERCIIVIKAQCHGCAYDPYEWVGQSRTMRYAHDYIERHWHELADGEVVDVEFILGECPTKKVSERFSELEVEADPLPIARSK